MMCVMLRLTIVLGIFASAWSIRHYEVTGHGGHGHGHHGKKHTSKTRSGAGEGETEEEEGSAGGSKGNCVASIASNFGRVIEEVDAIISTRKLESEKCVEKLADKAEGVLVVEHCGDDKEKRSDLKLFHMVHAFQLARFLIEIVNTVLICMGNDCAAQSGEMSQGQVNYYQAKRLFSSDMGVTVWFSMLTMVVSSILIVVMHSSNCIRVFGYAGKKDEQAMNAQLSDGILAILQSVVLKNAKAKGEEGGSKASAESAADLAVQGLKQMVEGATELVAKWGGKEDTEDGEKFFIDKNECSRILNEVIVVTQELYSRWSQISACHSSLMELLVKLDPSQQNVNMAKDGRVIDFNPDDQKKPVVTKSKAAVDPRSTAQKKIDEALRAVLRPPKTDKP